MPKTDLLGFSRSPNPAASSSLKPASLGSSLSRREQVGGRAVGRHELAREHSSRLRAVQSLGATRRTGAVWRVGLRL